MKLLQLNVWGGRLEYALLDLLEQEQPDIVCLQETISIDLSGTGLFLSSDMIQKALGLEHAAFGAVFSFDYMSSKARFGNCILSRFPIQDSNVVFTHLEHKDDFVWGKDDNNMRNFVHASISKDDKTYDVVTHHGFWVAEHKDGNDQTKGQMEQLSGYVAALKGPVILTGDFNLHPESESLQGLNSSLRNLSVEYGLETTRTSLTRKTEVCDYIFVNDAVEVSSFRASDRAASDHVALIAELN